MSQSNSANATSTSTSNVQRFPISNAYNDITIFLDRYKSKKTKTEYTRNIAEFFLFMHGKSTNELSKENIEYVSNQSGNKEKMMMKHADQYKSHLRKKHPNSESSVMAKLSAVRSLYKYLSVNGYDVNHLIFDLKFLEAKPESYDAIPSYLIVPFAEKALATFYGEELSVFFLVSAQTSIRASALFRLEFSKITFHKSSGLYEITVKGEKRDQTVTQPISNDTHERIMKLKEKNLDPKLVFPNLKLEWVKNMTKKIATEFEELDGLRIVTHSLRKSAPTYEWSTRKDPKALIAQTKHKNLDLALKTYVDDKEDYRERAGIRMMEKVNEGVLDHVSKEDLLSLLKKSNPSAYHGLLLDLEKVVGV